MIGLGYDPAEKQAVVADYVAQHAIRAIKVFAPEAFPLELESSVSVERIDYTDIIMYRYFYRLLEEITPDTLLVFNECLRTQKRSDLTYNCAHHYAGQTSHILVFEWFPFIEDPADFMILLDLAEPNRYKGQSIHSAKIPWETVAGWARRVTLETIACPVSDAVQRAYARRKDALFQALGERDPETIPRQLHLWAGNQKKRCLDPAHIYVARNQRFKRSNVVTYKEAGIADYVAIDVPHRRLDLNDYLKHGSRTRLRFLDSGLKVDTYYIHAFHTWQERMAAFYAEAGVSTP